MRRLFFTILSTASILVGPAVAQDVADKVPLLVTRQQLQIIGNGLAELPLKTSADTLNLLQQQLNAYDKTLEAAAKAKAEEAAKAAKPEPETKSDTKPPAK